MSILYQRVTSIRKSRGLSVYALEKGSGIGIDSLKTWKKSTPSSEKVLLMAQFLDVSTDYLLGNTDNPNSHRNNPQDLAAATQQISQAVESFTVAATAVMDKLQSDVGEIMESYHIPATEEDRNRPLYEEEPSPPAGDAE